MSARAVQPLDPDTPAGRAAAEALSQTLADILVAIRRREQAAARQTEPAGSTRSAA